MNFLVRIVWLSLGVVFFVGCANTIPTPNERKTTLLALASKDNYIVEKNIKSSKFTIFSLHNIPSECKNIKVFIEGDGLAWVSKSRVSQDPTPINPIGLKLMLSDEEQCKIYLARPCQYVGDDMCEERYWTSDRFSPEVIQSYDEALSSIKKDFNNTKFELIGYSGGGAVALLIGATRDDIDKITTIAGNIDTEFWTQYHNIDPLRNSLNPADFTVNLENITQHHLIGRNDKVIPKEVYFSYLSKFKNKKNISYSIYEASHSCCWEEIYKVFGKKNMWE